MYVCINVYSSFSLKLVFFSHSLKVIENIFISSSRKAFFVLVFAKYRDLSFSEALIVM